ncbi:MAG: methyltransferase domain-containing protein [Desulfuromonas sp.]|nr:MAG: methyltransferase domain-containing protein [Desulfuromonas sp.]
MNRASKNRLNQYHSHLFSSNSLFDRVAGAVCRAGCLPRKELYEAWEVARRVRRRFRGGRVVDLACGHGLLAHLMLLLDSTSQLALAVDLRLPPSAAKLANELQRDWPRLREQVEFSERKLEQIELTRHDLVVSAHACGSLSDTVLDLAVAAGARVAILPCCHDLGRNDTGDLQGWMPGPLAVDATRVARLRQAGYRVYTQTIPGDITPKNRLLLAEPVGP